MSQRDLKPIDMGEEGESGGMSSMVGFVDYRFEDVVIPRQRARECLAALTRRTRRTFSTLGMAMKHFGHAAQKRPNGDWVLEYIDLDVWDHRLELLYAVLAPFVRSGGLVTCADEDGTHRCYRFEKGRGYRIEGHVVYDGRPELLRTTRARLR